MTVGSISVVVPAYNVEQHIEECLRSILSQTRCPSEIVVCDDASTDSTPEKLREFGREIKVVRNEHNVGVGETLNRAIQASSGDWIAILSADDLWDPAHLDQVGQMLARWDEAAVAFCPMKLIGFKVGLWPLLHQIPCYDVPRFVLPELMRNNFVHPCGAIFRRKAYEKVGGFREIPYWYAGRRVQAEDYDFFLRLAVHYPLVAVREASACYRWHPNQSSQHIVAQYVLAFRYRVRLLQNLKKNNYDARSLEHLAERATMAWCEYLEKVWAERNVKGLRLMVRYGLRVPLFRRNTWRYLPRALLPAVVLSKLDVKFRQARSG